MADKVFIKLNLPDAPATWVPEGESKPVPGWDFEIVEEQNV